MKNTIRLILLFLLFFVGKSIFAQEVKVNDTIYKVEKEMVYIGGVDVTEKLTSENKAEKKQRKAEKALKQREKAHSNYNKATTKYEAAQKKYEKLQNKGKLSPVEEKKRLEKIEKLNQRMVKSKKKLK